MSPQCRNIWVVFNFYIIHFLFKLYGLDGLQYRIGSDGMYTSHVNVNPFYCVLDKILFQN